MAKAIENKIKVSELIPDDKNFNKGSEFGNSLISKSFEKFGAGRSILIDKNNKIIAGNKSTENYGAGGGEDVIVIESDGTKLIAVKRTDIDLDTPEGRELALADNATAKANIVWAEDVIASELGVEIGESWGVDMGKEITEAEEDDFDTTPPEEPKTVLGDLYEIGEHRLLCGDSTDSDSVAKLMNGEKADMVFTSPPYNISAGMYETYKDNLVSEEYIQFNINVIKNIKKVLRGILFWNISYNKNSRWEFLEIANQIRKEGFEFLELIVWNKKTAVPVVSKKMLTRQYEDIFVYADDETYNDIEMYEVLTNQKTVSFYKKTAKVFTNYWELTSQNSQLQNHKACFPVGLPGKAITLTTLSNDLLYEPFLGSGSTMVAAHQLKRKCYGMELDPKYCDVIVKRMITLDPTLTIKLNGVDVTNEWKS